VLLTLDSVRPMTSPTRHHFVNKWQKTLGPNQSALMAYTITDPSFGLRVTVDYEDEVDYQWRRRDSSQPVRIDKTSS
jgi:hypothetical protein